MKISVRNLGVITEADIDLKPLTVLVGPNNAGKTWLAYTLAGILSSYGLSKYTQSYLQNKVPTIFPTLEAFIDQVFNEGNATFDLYKFADEYGEQYFNDVASLARGWMSKYMHSDRILFAHLETSISLGKEKRSFLEKILQTSIRVGISVGKRRQGALLSSYKKDGEGKLIVYTTVEEQVEEALPREIISDRIVTTVFRSLHQALFPSVRIFPTERTTFLTPPLLERTQELDTFGQQTHHEQNLGGFVKPLNRFINMMYWILQTNMGAELDRKLEVEGSATIQKYIELAGRLEQDIMGGSIDFSTPEPGPGREILFKPGENFSLEIPIASSMVKELVPFSLYLRHLAEPGELLIIDEPEMNLHPEAQVKLTEFLAMLVNAGLRVLVTTHSTYVVDHLINLMDAAKHENKDEIANLFFLQRPDAFIAQDNVSVYLIEQGKAQNILDENGIIHWDTFSNVTDRVERIHFQL